MTKWLTYVSSSEWATLSSLLRSKSYQIVRYKVYRSVRRVSWQLRHHRLIFRHVGTICWYLDNPQKVLTHNYRNFTRKFFNYLSAYFRKFVFKSLSKTIESSRPREKKLEKNNMYRQCWKSSSFINHSNSWYTNFNDSRYFYTIVILYYYTDVFQGYSLPGESCIAVNQDS